MSILGFTKLSNLDNASSICLTVSVVKIFICFSSMKKYLKFLFLPLVVFFLAFVHLSASEDVILDLEVNEGGNLIYFVNELEEYLHTPSAIIFSFVEASLEDQESTAVLGTAEETVRIDNATSGEVELTASLDVSNFLDDAKWSDGENSYLAYSEDGGTSGGLAVDPSVSSIATEGCEASVLSRGSASRFTPESSESIDIFTTTGGEYCRYDLTGVDLTQTIPGRTPSGNYSLGMVLTLTGGSSWIPEYTLEYTAGDNGEIICDTFQTVSYGEDGSEVEANPDPDYHFLMWSDLSEDNPRTDTNVTEDISVEAIFESESNPYTLNAYASPPEGGSVEIQGDTEGVFYHGDEATVIASTSTGYEFIGWSDDSEIVSEDITYVFPMTGNRTLVAEFELEEYELTISSGAGGSTYPSPGTHTYSYGQEVVVYALPDSDYLFTGWSGACSGFGDCELTITEDKNVSASFEMSSEPQYFHVVSYISGSGGSVLPSLRVVGSGETSSSPAVSPEVGYEFVNFTIAFGSGNGELDTETGEVTDVQGDMIIQANFISFDPCDGESNIELGGETYSLVGIGNQCWMQENLNYDGHSSGESWCYRNDSSNCDTYGRLYNWEAAQEVCPSGTVLPSDSDWKELEEYLGMSSNQSNSLRWRGVNEEVGVQLKTSSWNGTNSSGFTAFPGGWRYFYDGTGTVGIWWDGNEHLFRGKFWSSSEASSNTSWYRGLQRDEDGVHRWPQNKGDAYSVRCVVSETHDSELCNDISSTQTFINEGYVPIANCQELLQIDDSGLQVFGANTIWEGEYEGGRNKNYVQVTNLDCDGIDFPGIGTPSNRFSGTYDGRNCILDNLTINLPELTSVGIFRETSGAQIRNMIITNPYVLGQNGVGVITGRGESGTIIEYIEIVDGNIVAVSHQVGGIVGRLRTNSVLAFSSVTGEVRVEGSPTSIYRGAGGLVGYAHGSSTIIRDSWASADVYGSSSGSNVHQGTGGILGYGGSRAKVRRCWSNGFISASSRTGGLVGNNPESTSVLNSYYDTELSGQSDTGKGIPKTTSEMQQGYPSPEIYTDWDTNIWEFSPTSAYPRLKWSL